MKQSYTISSTPELHFGKGKINELPRLASRFGSNALVITGKSSFMKTYTALGLFQDFDLAPIDVQLASVHGEPTPSDIDSIVRENCSSQPNVVIAIGGGSVIDAGKAISAMLCEQGGIVNYLEDVGTQSPSGNKVPFIAVPTTAGTGSEATKNAVITEPGTNGFKKSLRHNNYVPNIALVDPLLTLYCPPAITAASGMDAFTQLLEAYLSTNSNPYTQILALEGIRNIIDALELVYCDGANEAARTKMSYAAYLSGIALANAGLGLVHGFAQPLGSFFQVTHGVVCGTLMGATNRITVERLRETGNDVYLERYATVAKMVSAETDEDKAIDQLLDYIDQLTLKLQIPKLSEFGINEADIPFIVANTGQKNHPITLKEQDLEWIIRVRT